MYGWLISKPVAKFSHACPEIQSEPLVEFSMSMSVPPTRWPSAQSCVVWRPSRRVAIPLTMEADAHDEQTTDAYYAHEGGYGVAIWS